MTISIRKKAESEAMRKLKNIPALWAYNQIEVLKLDILNGTTNSTKLWCELDTLNNRG